MTTENERFAGKVAFITGAASGIGRATAVAFARAGASVVIADLAQEENEQTARLIQASGGRALALRCDVTRSEDVKAGAGRDDRHVRAPRLRLQQRRRRTAG